MADSPVTEEQEQTAASGSLESSTPSMRPTRRRSTTIENGSAAEGRSSGRGRRGGRRGRGARSVDEDEAVQEGLASEDDGGSFDESSYGGRMVSDEDAGDADGAGEQGGGRVGPRTLLDPDELEAFMAAKTPVCRFAAKLSDRAIQRITGGNAFLRGRIYARRNSVEELTAGDEQASAHITVRNQPDPYTMSIRLDDEHKVVSECTCSGWRGPTGHCKHVAALLVALRDRERPPRPKAPPQENGGQANGKKKGRGERSGASAGASALASTPVHVPQTVSVGGKRRRSRRRRRGVDSKVEVLSAEQMGLTSSVPERGGLEAWLPPEGAPSKAHEFEYRLQVRAASITVTAVLAGSRSAVPIADALAAFNAVAAEDRGILRSLSRHVTRGAPASAEVRGEDAAEMLAMLRGRRVLLEPASMELRFADEPLKPRLELDRAQGDSVRLRVVFESANGQRRFQLSNGAWFEGTPGWHLDTTEGVARQVVDSVTPAWLQRLYRSPSLVHPINDLPHLLTAFIPKVSASLGAELPELENVAHIVDEAPEFAIKADGDIVGAQVRLKVAYGDYEFDVPPEGFPSPLEFMDADEEDDDDLPWVIRRDVGAEMVAVQRLLDLNFEVDESGEAFEVKGDDAVNFWTVGIGSLPAEWERFIPNDLAGVTVRKDAVSAQVRVSSGVDWLDLQMSFDAGGVAVAEDELRMCLEKGRRLVRLEDGTYAPIDESQVGEVLARMAEIYATGGDGKRLPLTQAGRVQDLLSMVNRSHVTPKAKELFGRLADVGEIPNVAKPRNLKATLRDYQKRGFNWLVFLQNMKSGGILADDMGLGKTVQTIALMLHAKSKAKEKRPHLVVAPTSVVPNWEREIGKFAPSLSCLVWQGPGRHGAAEEVPDADVVITSYALIRRDEEFLAKQRFNYVVLDEAQHIKNPISATARSAKKLESEHRLALTGTPIENRLSEFWSIVDFVSPGLLGDLKTFEEKIARPIDRGDQATADKLRTTIKPFVLRRTKEEVAPELPEKIEQEIVVPLADAQSNLYSQILREVRKSVLSEVEKQGVAKSQIQILAALTRLRQVACDPRLTKLPGEWDDDESGKLGALREILQEAVEGGHRVLIFSQFVEMLQIIKSALEADGIKYEYLDGSTKNRIEKVDAFNDDESIQAFLISLKAGGTGLNLTGADTVVHFDPWWNPAVEDQATDRAHRIGQTKVVSVYRLIARGTVEEKILQLSAKKRALMENVLSTEGSPLKGLTKADVEALFSE